MKTGVNIMIIDDHSMVNSALASLLEETGRFRVCGEAYSLADAMESISALEGDMPALIILDILLGEENGLDFLPFLDSLCRERKIPKPPVLVCSVLEEPFRIHTAMKMGASGYIPKTRNRKELLEAIDSVLRGEIFMSSEHSAMAMKSYGLYARFTKRELEIFNLIRKNKTNREIAEALGLSVHTIENHIGKIYLKTGTGSRQELFGL